MNYDKIREYNSRLMTRLSEYINNYADFITPEMISETMSDCNIGKEDAFRVLAAGILDVYDNREIMTKYIRNMFRLLDAGKYENDPYYRSVILENISDGGWSIERRRYKPYEAFVYNDLLKKPDGRVIPQIGFFDREYSFPCILQEGREWMLITPNEVETMEKPVAQASGDVATYGLGLGYFTFMASMKPEVSGVTVIERDENAIALFNKHILPQFPCREKIRVICDDAFVYAAQKHRHDFVFADIWHDPSDGIEAYLKFRALERPDVRYAYWIEDTIKCYL